MGDNAMRAKDQKRTQDHVQSLRKMGKVFIVSGVRLRMFSSNKLCQVFSITRTAFEKWVDAGVIGEPFMYMTTKDERRVAYWSFSQTINMLLIVRQFYVAGFKVIHWRKHPRACEAILQGCADGAATTRTLIERSLRHREVKQRRKDYPKYGVVFEDS